MREKIMLAVVYAMKASRKRKVEKDNSLLL